MQKVNVNEMVIPVPQEHNTEESQVLSLGNVCMVDGSLTSTALFSGCGCFWIKNIWKTQLIGTQNYTRQETALHSKVKAV